MSLTNTENESNKYCQHCLNVVSSTLNESWRTNADLTFDLTLFLLGFWRRLRTRGQVRHLAILIFFPEYSFQINIYWMTPTIPSRNRVNQRSTLNQHWVIIFERTQLCSNVFSTVKQHRYTYVVSSFIFNQISTLTNVDDQLFFKVDSALFNVGFVVAIKKIATSNQPIPSISDLGK